MKRLSQVLRAVGAYGGVGAASLVAAFVLLRLWQADLHVPFLYGGDTLLTGMFVKSVIDHGWYLDNPQLGGPAGLQLHDFPLADVAHLFTIRIMSLFSGDWALLVNLYFLLGFPMIAISAAAVFRHFRVGWRPALVGSLLYAFLPSRLLKGEAHLFLDVFYQVPLGVLLTLWVCGEEPPLLRDRPAGRRPALDLRNPRSIAAIAICVLMGMTGLYYAFFTAVLLVSGGIWASVERRSARNALAGLALSGVIAATIVASILPTIVYHARVGPNVEVATREAGDAELFGLKIAQLVLPVDGHRVPMLRHLKKRYSAHAPLVNENSTASLGLMGSVGFLGLLALSLFLGTRTRPPQNPRAEAAREPDPALVRPLVMLNLTALLLATVGGFGSLFALLITPTIRSYCRIHVVMGFLGLFALVLLLDRLARRRKWLAFYALPAILAIGLLDQVTAAAVPAYQPAKVAYSKDAEFFRRIEDSVPPHGMIFELPFQSFPEAGPVNRMDDYEQLRGYLHSRTLHWTYPTMRARAGEVWVKGVATREPGPMLDVLSDAGVAGILINRRGYPPGDSTLETTLLSLLGAEPMVNADGQLAFFNLAAFERRTHAQDSPHTRERKRDDALHPLVFVWANGCYHVEASPGGPFHWCSRVGEIQVENDSRIEREATIKLTMVPAFAGARMTIEGDLTSLPTTTLPGEGMPFARVVKVPPGHHVIRFRCDGRAVVAPSDPRTMLWRAEQFTLAELARPAVAP
jgi:hypothetical protein